jgi:hypothetical protein
MVNNYVAVGVCDIIITTGSHQTMKQPLRAYFNCTIIFPTLDCCIANVLQVGKELKRN